VFAYHNNNLSNHREYLCRALEMRIVQSFS